MGDSDKDAAFDEANVLLRKGRFDEAIVILRGGRDACRRDGDFATAAFYSSVTGSFLASRGLDEEALKEYQAAEDDDPDDAAWTLTTTNHLIDLDQGAEAYAKALEALSKAGGEPSFLHAAYSLLGLADLALGREGDAIGAFSKSTASGLLRQLPASSCDLRLAERLLSQRLAVTLSRKYLSEVRLKARAEGDDFVSQSVLAIEIRYSDIPDD